MFYIFYVWNYEIIKTHRCFFGKEILSFMTPVFIFWQDTFNSVFFFYFNLKNWLLYFGSLVFEFRSVELRLLYYSEAYLETFQTYMMKLFWEILNDCKSTIFAKLYGFLLIWNSFSFNQIWTIETFQKY